MRDDQIKRLEELGNELIDVVLEESDPKEWPGAGKPLASLEQQERGDRYWCKKNAGATLVLAMKIHSLVETRTRPDWKPSDKDAEDLEAEQKAAEREAAKVLERIHAGGAKPASRRTH